MTEAQLTTIAGEYYQAQPYLSVPHPRHMVLFSGVPGSGKSHLATYLQEKLQGVRVSNDELRDRLHTAEGAYIERDAEQRFLATLGSLLLDQAAESPNGLVIIDSSCDRQYDRYARLAAQGGYTMTVLRLKVPRPLLEERLSSRPHGAHQLARLDSWLHDWEAFGERPVPSVTVTPSTNPADIAELVRSRLSGEGVAA